MHSETLSQKLHLRDLHDKQSLSTAYATDRQKVILVTPLGYPYSLFSLILAFVPENIWVL